MSSLKDIYIDQMQDIYSACKQSKDATQKLHDAATDSELKSALKAGVEGIEQGMSTLSEIIKGHGEDPTDEFCKGMEGLVKEVHAHVLDTDFTDDDVRDAMIITQYQRMAHYAIAGYGCCKAFGKRLGQDDDVTKLDKCLDASYDGDKHMTEIATHGINKAAAA
ncbi:ferritin-like domain-containing protein [Roseobacter sp. HKCCA0434]|uniref:ferritin-like domain-containing protein n=1 Tax=Roseobacter sp. HKCCA0434 TaxID=3079297 RepID=UPI002905E7CE|nr:ferritin-like domain-containing protein [Roseobacter sp. HKCCA0434]